MKKTAMLIRTLLLLAAAPLLSGFAAAQSSPTFAVTSVKPATGDPGPFGITFDGGHAKLWNITVADMLRDAFGLTTNDQLPGMPDWAAKERWDINATEDESVAQELERGSLDARIALMHHLILDLLHDRFALKETNTTRVLPAYELAVAKGGAKVRPAGPADGKFRGLTGGNGNITATGAPMSLLRMRLSVMPEVQGHPIVDHTGMTGEYAWTLRWTPELSAPNPEATDVPGLFEAMQQQLGMKLVPTKTAVPAVQIDSISRPQPD